MRAVCVIEQASLQEVENIELKLPGQSSSNRIISFTLQLSLLSVMCSRVCLVVVIKKYLAAVKCLII